jgi:thiol-disulfide isomerase/thioredoxin
MGVQMIRRCLTIVLLIAAGRPAFAADPLTIGSPAPPLDLGAFVKGEPVKELAKGVVHVIEFSGTECAPCVRCIPHLTELQKKHPEVVFISVYSEKEPAVRQFLAKHGEAMGFRVALDRNYAMVTTWLRAASLAGIPTVFVVGADGALAWIGSPFDLADPLRKLLEGTLDTRFDRVRLQFEQADVASSRATQDRMDRSSKLLSRINRDLLMQRNWSEAIQAAEQAARDYPEQGFLFNSYKLYALAANPETTDTAIEFAARLSATVHSSWGDLAQRSRAFDVEIAQCLANRENNDPRLLEAATILLRKAEASLSELQNDGDRINRKIYIGRIFATVHAHKKDFDAAAARLHEVLALVRERPFRAGAGQDQEQWDRDQRAIISEIEAELAEYAKAAGKGK